MRCLYDDSRDELRASIIRYAQRTGRLTNEILVGDLAELIGEILTVADYDEAQLLAIAEDLRDRIVTAAKQTTVDMDEVLNALEPLGGKH